jgi:serine/threonine protein kinase
MALTPGTRLGPYEISARLGAGGMGVVYRAKDLRLRRDVALKVLPVSDGADPSARSQLLREARSAATLQHPNICVVYDVGEADDQVFIAMECVEGTSLDARIARGRLESEQIVEFGVQLADALGHAHRAGVIHRDLEPLSPTTRSDHGRILYRARQYPQAIEQFNEALRLDAGFVPALYRLSDTQLMLQISSDTGGPSQRSKALVRECRCRTCAH